MPVHCEVGGRKGANAATSYKIGLHKFPSCNKNNRKWNDSVKQKVLNRYPLLKYVEVSK